MVIFPLADQIRTLKVFIKPKKIAGCALFDGKEQKDAGEGTGKESRSVFLLKELNQQSFGMCNGGSTETDHGGIEREIFMLKMELRRER